MSKVCILLKKMLVVHLTNPNVLQCRSNLSKLVELSFNSVNNRVSIFFTLSTNLWMHKVIEVLIEQTQRNKGREKAAKSETERYNHVTKFALAVSQKTFLKGKGGWEVCFTPNTLSEVSL